MDGEIYLGAMGHHIHEGLAIIDILALLAGALVLAKIAGGLAEKVGIPSVLAELVTGIVTEEGLLTPKAVLTYLKGQPKDS